MLDKLPIEIIINHILPSLNDNDQINLMITLYYIRDVYLASIKTKTQFINWITATNPKHWTPLRNTNLITIPEYNKIISPKRCPDLQHFLLNKEPYSYILSLCNTKLANTHKPQIYIADYGMHLPAYYIKLYFIRQNHELFNICFGITSLVGSAAFFAPNNQGLYSGNNLLIISFQHFINRLYTSLKTDNKDLIKNTNINLELIQLYKRPWKDYTWEFIQHTLGKSKDPVIVDEENFNTIIKFHPQIRSNPLKFLNRQITNQLYIDN